MADKDTTSHALPEMTVIDQKTLDQSIKSNQVTQEQLSVDIGQERMVIERYNKEMLEKSKEDIEKELKTDEYTAMKNRVDNLNQMYLRLFELFPVEMPMFKEYLEFCSKHTSRKKINDKLNFLASKVHENPEVYISLANYVYKNLSDVELARHCYAKGCEIHKSYRRLFIEAFWLEVEVLEDTNGSSLPIALNTYKTCIEHFEGNFNFHSVLVDKALTQNIIRVLNTRVVSDMVEKYKSNIKMWQKLAKINFSGFIFDRKAGILSYDRHFKRRLMNSCKAFEDGSKQYMSPKKTRRLWTYYTEFIIDIWKSVGRTNESIQSCLNVKMDWVFENAHDRRALKKEYYVYWAEFMKNGCDKIVVQRAIRLNKDNPDIWLEILNHYLKYDMDDMMNKVLKDGTESLGNLSLPLWQAVCDKLEKTNHQNRIRTFYREATFCQYEPVNSIFKFKYLNWSHIHHGLSLTRKLFKEMEDHQLLCKHLFKDMVLYEINTYPTNEIFVSKLLYDACMKCGKNDVEVWFDCIKFDYTHENRIKAKQVFKEASSFLDPERMIELKNKFDKIKADCRVNNYTTDPDVICIDDRDD